MDMKPILTFLVIFWLYSIAVAVNPGKIARIDILRETADSLHSVGRTDSAAVVGERAIELAEEMGDLVQIVGTHAAQGVFLRSLGDVNGALASYNRALDIVTSGQFRENPNQEAIEEIASLYINLAVLNLDMQHKDDAVKNAVFSEQWIDKSNDPDLKSVIYGVVGSVLTGCGEFEKALQSQAKAYQNAIEADNAEAAFRASAYTMLIADRLGDNTKAQQWRGKCLEILPSINSTTAKLVYYQAECSICLKKGRQKEAITYFEKILNLDGIDNMPFIQYDCYNNMHIAYSELGDYDRAYATLLKGNELRDSIWEHEKTESLRDLMVKYETKETELALAQSEARRNATLMWLSAAVALLVAVVAIFIVYANRQRRRRLQQYIDGLETERSRMSRELHDGVCNDLLAIQMTMTNPENIALIKSCREAVRRISHELMPPEFEYATIDEAVRYFIGKQQQGGRTVSYTSEAIGNEWQAVPERIALEVYRIIQEAVGNSLKHSGGDIISVNMSLSGDTLVATVTDNGHYAVDGKRGLGVDSMRRRAEAIGAKIDILMSETDGTKVNLAVKI